MYTMDDYSSTYTLKSAGIGKVLLQIFWVRLGFSIASGLFSLLEVTAKPVYQLIAVLDGLVSIVTVIIVLVSLIVFFIWLHRIHADLKNLFNSYPVTPAGAVAKFLIPIYNIWGIFNVLSTFADRFKPEGGDLTSLGEKVRSAIGLLYALTFGSNTIARFVFNEIRKNPDSASLPFWYLLSGAVDVGLVYVLILVTQAMQKAVAQKAKRAVA